MDSVGQPKRNFLPPIPKGPVYLVCGGSVPKDAPFGLSRQESQKKSAHKTKHGRSSGRRGQGGRQEPAVPSADLTSSSRAAQRSTVPSDGGERAGLPWEQPVDRRGRPQRNTGHFEKIDQEENGQDGRGVYAPAAGELSCARKTSQISPQGITAPSTVRSDGAGRSGGLRRQNAFSGRDRPQRYIDHVEKNGIRHKADDLTYSSGELHQSSAQSDGVECPGPRRRNTFSGPDRPQRNTGDEEKIHKDPAPFDPAKPSSTLMGAKKTQVGRAISCSETVTARRAKSQTSRPTHLSILRRRHSMSAPRIGAARNLNPEYFQEGNSSSKEVALLSETTSMDSGKARPTESENSVPVETGGLGPCRSCYGGEEEAKRAATLQLTKPGNPGTGMARGQDERQSRRITERLQRVGLCDATDPAARERIKVRVMYKRLITSDANW